MSCYYGKFEQLLNNRFDLEQHEKKSSFNILVAAPVVGHPCRPRVDSTLQVARQSAQSTGSNVLRWLDSLLTS